MPGSHHSGVQSGNLFADVPKHLEEELFSTLLTGKDWRLQRIVSRQHRSKDGQWYDQAQHEWVLLVSGSAQIRFTDPEELIVLQAGDHVLIPAHRRHRVEETDPQSDTVWLTLHFSGAGV